MSTPADGPPPAPDPWGGGQVKLELGIWNEGGQKVCSLNDPDGT
jgi:hypothetical protein